jgi:putative MFS transporter
MKTATGSFHHPLAFWTGCALITFGVLAHLPMFLHAAPMGYRMVGMPMSTTMLVGMALIPVGLVGACYGLMPRLRGRLDGSDLSFHAADLAPLTVEHWKLLLTLLAAISVDVMKPATLGFVMPGMTLEYGISTSEAGTLALVALTGTAIGSIAWGRMADLMGRRSAILLSALMFIGTAICGAMPAFEWNLIMCFLMGLSAGGLLPITFTLMAEMVPTAHRGWALVALGGIGTSAGYLLASGAAALLEPIFSWRILWMLGLPTGLLIILLNRYLPESPRFLSSMGRTEEAAAVLRRYNSKLSAEASDAGIPDDHLIMEKGDLRLLVRGAYSWITVGLVGTSLAWGLVNFGFLLWLPTNLRAMGMEATAASQLLARAGILAVPGIVGMVWLYHRWSSIKSLVAFIVLTLISLLGFAALASLGSPSPWLLKLATAALLISASGVIAMLIPYAAEIYPVRVRGSGSGIVAASSKAGGILGAALGMTGIFDSLAGSALLIAIPLAALAALLAMRGVETRGRRLEEMHRVVQEKFSG